MADKLYDQAKIMISRSIIGFLHMTLPVPERPCAGSGTLARIGGEAGIITAAHVLAALDDIDEIGLVYYTGRTARLRVPRDHIREVAKFGQKPWAPGPDLAFIALPYDTVEALEAFGCTFFNMDLRRERLLRNEYDSKSFFCSAGTVGERTIAKQGEGRVDVDVGALVELVEPRQPVERTEPFDYAECDIPGDADYAPPNSYEGMSGGGLFLAHISVDNKGVESVSEVNLVGVNFLQSKPENGRRTLICHYANSIYGPLFEEVMKGISNPRRS